MAWCWEFRDVQNRWTYQSRQRPTWSGVKASDPVILAIAFQPGNLVIHSEEKQVGNLLSVALAIKSLLPNLVVVSERCFRVCIAAYFHGYI